MSDGGAGAQVVVRGLKVSYHTRTPEVRALRGIDLDVPRGQFVCIRGKSGSGKSTLLHAIAGLLKPTEGTIQVEDVSVEKLSSRQTALYRRRHCGVVFQFFNLLPLLDVRANIGLPLSLDGVRKDVIARRVDGLLEELEIADRGSHMMDELSGGEMQRVAIARAIAIEPSVILADEPTGNLDTATGGQIWDLMRRLAHEKSVTTIMVTHDPDATGYADRVIELEDGLIVKDSGDLSAALDEGERH